ncbi:sensor domain-containing diguanylate cyclase [Pseudoalteromonas sp. S2755]|uniref:sensor domain-containing diguanylate cyclase n=1 Tax=Pseudoalteromonas sp. S2755 TaxID=2066523 RepID=UPI00110A74FB|nr:sensor domain-containing diguanylate cyclase [Pseudoalteromonas sp. S2755]TMN42429.1 GGDEF domain-containing protein [Pseudoalteromonas sp. S2755]
MTKYGLIVRLALVLVVSTFIFSMLYAKLYHDHIVERELRRSNTIIGQIGQTVSSSSSIATYLNDKDLAVEVINGLVSNDVISSAAIKSEEKWLAQSVGFKPQNATIIKLNHPFLLSEIVGEVYIQPNSVFIEQSARDIARSSVQTLLVVIIPILIIFTVVTHFIVTKPLSNLSSQIAKVIPGTPLNLIVPKGHESSEIGDIASNTNQLIAKTASMFEQERQLRADIEVLEKRFRLMFERSSSPTLLVKDKGEVILANDAACDLLTGMAIDLDEYFPESFGRYCKTPDILYTFTEHTLELNQPTQSEFEFINPMTDQPVWLSVIMLRVESSGQFYLQVFLSDITLRKTVFQELSKKANRDKLTGLYNRHGTEIKINEWLDNETPFSLFIIDLDEFKPINDIYGHNAGDAMLKHIATQISTQVREQDVVCRWGGDEFLIALHCAKNEKLQRIAENLLEAINTEMIWQTPEGKALPLRVGASIGIASYPRDAVELSQLIECADVAMYTVKKDKKNAFQFYSLSA